MPEPALTPSQRRKDRKGSQSIHEPGDNECKVCQVRENEIAKAIVDCAYHIHKELGPGLLESVYESLLEHELRRRGFDVKTQIGLPVQWGEIRLDKGYRIDLLVDDLVVVEIKSVKELEPVHYKQVLTYLKLSGKRLGLLINFNEALIKRGIHRLVNNLPE